MRRYSTIPGSGSGRNMSFRRSGSGRAFCLGSADEVGWCCLDEAQTVALQHGLCLPSGQLVAFV